MTYSRAGRFLREAGEGLARGFVAAVSTNYVLPTSTPPIQSGITIATGRGIMNLVQPYPDCSITRAVATIGLYGSGLLKNTKGLGAVVNAAVVSTLENTLDASAGYLVFAALGYVAPPLQVINMSYLNVLAMSSLETIPTSLVVAFGDYLLNPPQSPGKTQAQEKVLPMDEIIEAPRP